MKSVKVDVVANAIKTGKDDIDDPLDGFLLIFR